MEANFDLQQSRVILNINLKTVPKAAPFSFTLNDIINGTTHWFVVGLQAIFLLASEVLLINSQQTLRDNYSEHYVAKLLSKLLKKTLLWHTFKKNHHFQSNSSNLCISYLLFSKNFNFKESWWSFYLQSFSIFVNLFRKHVF